MKKLTDLLMCLNYECLNGNENIHIENIVYDSKKVTKNSLFICIKGVEYDGHNFLNEVIRQGAVAILVQDEVELPKQVTVIKVEDTRYAMAYVSAAYFDYPARKLKVIGVTGTKGKTTTTYMVKSILESIGYRVGLIGTIETIIGDKSLPAKNTTPESYILQQYLYEMVTADIQVVVMEVSSQGLMLHRTAGILFEIGIFMNIAADHIGPGEHESFEEYIHFKGLLFKQCKIGIANIDDKNMQQVLKGHTCHLETIGFHENADYRATDLTLISNAGQLGIAYNVSGKQNFNVIVNIPGKFSVYNSLTAIAISNYFKASAEQIQTSLKEVKVKGRIEMITAFDSFSLMIDYAHNAMSLENLLTTLREYNPNRLVVLFGCGGNRSKLRRYEMGEIAGKLADLTIITSDNPRFEEPQDIIDDIKCGIKKTTGQFVEIVDRQTAIAYAVHQSEPGDIIVLAGKGHETYQEIKGQKYPMDERDIITDILIKK